MAKAKEPATLADIQQLEEQLAGMDMLTDEVKASIIKEAKAKLYEGARNDLSGSISKVVGNSRFDTQRQLLAGNRMYVTIEFKEDGTFDLAERIRTTPSGSKSDGKGSGGSHKVEVDGKTYDSAAEACRAHNLEYKGDSAVRVLKRALAAGQIKTFNQLEGDDSEEEGGGDSEG